MDPDGRIVFFAILGKALAGGVISAGIDYGIQVVTNFTSGQSGLDAFTDVNIAEIGGSFVEGAINGALLPGVSKASSTIWNNGGKKIVQTIGNASVGAISAVPATITENIITNTQSSNADVALTDGLGENVVTGAIGNAVAGIIDSPTTYKKNGPDYIQTGTNTYKRVNAGREIIEGIVDIGEDAVINYSVNNIQEGLAE